MAVTGEEATSLSIADLVDRAVTRFPDRQAYVFEDQRFTFAQAGVEIDRVARALLWLGVDPGDRIAVWMHNNIEWVWIYLAAARVQAVIVPVNTGLSVEEAAYVIGHCGARFLVADDDPRTDLISKAQKIAGQDDVAVEQVIQVERFTSAVPDVVSFADALQRAEGVDGVDVDALERRRAAVTQSDLAMMLYTSGTTGFPKGAMHTHRVVRNMVDVAEHIQLSGEDTVVMYLPLYHVFAAAGVLSFLWAGGRIVITRRFDAAQSLDLMERERATVVYGISTMYYDQIHCAGFDQRDLSRVRFCMCPATGDFLRWVDERLGPAYNAYGMTETTSVTCLPAIGETQETRSDTVGRPMPGFSCRVVGPDGSEVGVDEVGELVVRGHPVMEGYYRKPDETAAVLDEQGWFRTGDAMSRTAGGHFRYDGRIKDMFRVGGENVDPVEVEVVLSRHAAVGLVSVVGMPDQRLGEVGVAFVQLVPGATASESELIAHARHNLARYKVPRRVVFVDDFPKTGTGKIQKHRLRERLAADSGG